MRNRNAFILLITGILLVAVLSAGCSDDGQAGGSQTTVPTTAAGAKFVTGDIVAKTATSTDTMLLVVKYDAATDKYERAFVKKRPDGSFYRENDKSDLMSRSSLEKLYPAKITHVSSLSQVPVVTPTTATTAPTATVTTTVTTSYPAPTVSSITPNAGLAGTTVTITSISGTNFRSGATVRLVNATTSVTVSGTSVVTQSATNITCIFSIPSTAIAGVWHVTITNSDGNFGTFENGFMISNGTTTTQPTTTETTAPPAPTVSAITTSSGFTGATVAITNLAGTNLLNSTSVKLTRSSQSDIPATDVVVVSSTQVTCTFSLTGAQSGQWNVLVTNSAGQSGIGTNLFTVNPVAAFSASNLSGAAPLVVAFTDSSAGSPAVWSWTFEGTNTSNLQNPVYTYVTPGSYSVSLTVSNGPATNSTTRANYITVT